MVLHFCGKCSLPGPQMRGGGRVGQDHPMLAYFDCFAGIAGDMTVAALLDLGLDEGYLKEQLGFLDLDSYSLTIRKSRRRGVSGTRFIVDVHEGQPHRTYRQIRAIIEDSPIDDRPKGLALKIFEIIATAESRVHGIPNEEVHFHEVGAVDSIIDVVACAVGVHKLGIEQVICSPLPLARGYVKTRHGNIPTPAPATTEILRDIPVKGMDSPIELVTPTGAAIARVLAASFGPYPDFVPEKIGYGLGTSDPEQFPNALRIVLGTAKKSDWVTTDRVGVLECQVDDLDPRVLGSLMDLLLSMGALDVAFTSVQMKKNRPGTLITVLAPPELVQRLSDALLTHTTTLGVRVALWDRVVLQRCSRVIMTSFGELRVKVVNMPGGRQEQRVEFDDVRNIAQRIGKPVRDVLRTLERELNGRGD